MTTTVTLNPLIQSEGHIAARGTSGAITVHVAPGEGKVRITVAGYHSATAPEETLVLTTTARGPDCGDALSFDTGPVAEAAGPGALRPYPWENTYQDLSMLKFAVISRPGVSWQDACSKGEDIVVALHWSVPAALSHLAVVDHGSRDGAQGSVVIRSGKPLRYVVASNDLLDNVASRFGLMPDELLWLTPSRSHGQDGQLYSGEELNLDPAYRGIRT